MRTALRRTAGRIALVGGAETLLGAERALARRGIRVDRILAFQYDPVARNRLRQSLARFGPYDLLFLTSQEAVRVMAGAGLLPRTPGTRNAPRVVAAGPQTARALRASGVPARWLASAGAGRSAAARFAARPPLRIVYPRSDRAGPSVAQELARAGHTVLDLVAYHVRPIRRPGRATAERVRLADRVLVTSPSALASLRQSLGSVEFDRLRRRGVLVVLGATSARAARGHGFRAVRVVPSIREAAVARFLEQEVTSDAR